MAGTNQAAKKTTTAKPAAKKDALRIHAKRPHRRAGHDFGEEPVTILKSKLTKEQIAMLEGDGQLVVEAVKV